jgi:hypothetical protein
MLSIKLILRDHAYSCLPGKVVHEYARTRIFVSKSGNPCPACAIAQIARRLTVEAFARAAAHVSGMDEVLAAAAANGIEITRPIP